MQVGRCATCKHSRTVRGKRNTFWMCERSATDPSFPRYPRLPVKSCRGYERTDGAPQETPDVPTTVQPRRNGPLFVRGDIEVINGEGEVIRRATRIAFCRCGQSNNKPYCDLSHRAVGFQAE